MIPFVRISVQFAVVAFMIAMANGSALAAPQVTKTPDGYRVHQTIAPDAATTGLSGTLEILEDDRITPTLRRAMWGRSYMLDMILDAKDPVQQEFEKEPMRPAHLRLVDASAHVLRDETFEVPLAGIKIAYLYGNRFPTYLVTADYSTGLGSYSGPSTSFAEIRNGRFDYVRLPELAGKTDDRFVLARTLKTDWRILGRPQGTPAVIQSVSCRPDFDNTKSDDFSTTYSTYRFDGTHWHQASRQRRELWENESRSYLAPESKSDWPEARLFP